MNQLRLGIQIETEHKDTIAFIRAYNKKFHRMPSNYEIEKHIAADHIRENPRYYFKLKRAGL